MIVANWIKMHFKLAVTGIKTLKYLQSRLWMPQSRYPTIGYWTCDASSNRSAITKIKLFSPRSLNEANFSGSFADCYRARSAKVWLDQKLFEQSHSSFGSAWSNDAIHSLLSQFISNCLHMLFNFSSFMRRLNTTIRHELFILSLPAPIFLIPQPQRVNKHEKHPSRCD